MEPINRIREISINDQVRPLVLCIVIICFRINLINHCWIVIKRLLIRRLGEGNRIIGNIIIIVTTGMPINVGVMKEANRFSFIFLLRVFCILYFLNKLF